MGIFDDLSTALSRGTAAASRIADTASMRIKLADADRRKREAYAALGEHIYDTVVASPDLSAGREQFLSDIAARQAECDGIREEIARLEEEAAEAKASQAILMCPACGSALAPGARFCALCGTPIAGTQPAADQEPAAQRVYTQANPQTPGASSQGGTAQPQQPQSYEIPVSQEGFQG